MAFVYPRYSFDYGLAHFTVMSTEHDYSPGSRQYNWLKKDLEDVDRRKTPWVIFAGHRPMYHSLKCSGKGTLILSELGLSGISLGT